MSVLRTMLAVSRSVHRLHIEENGDKETDFLPDLLTWHTGVSLCQKSNEKSEYTGGAVKCFARFVLI